jgi:dethiobiotin synthetase
MSHSFQLKLTSDLASIKQHKIICITGTDTGIGKTIATGLLAKELASHGSVVTQKWVQSGDLDCPDIKTHDQLSEQVQDAKWLDDRQVYSFNDPVSPHLAAKLANETVNPIKLIQASQRLAEQFDTVLVETSGGIMVPLTENVTTGDVVSQMKLPTIVVVPNKLGTINHTLLTMNYLKQHQIPVLGFIMNHFDLCESQLQVDNPSIIQKLSEVPLLATIVNAY